MASILYQHDAGDRGVPELRFAIQLLESTAAQLEQDGVEGEVPVLNRPDNSWTLPEGITGIRDRLHQALDHPEQWLGLRRSGSVEVELERRAHTVPFLDLNADAKRVLSEGLESSLDHLRQGIDANLRTLDIDTSLRYLHWCIYEVMPKLQSSLARSALEKNEAHQLAWQPCTLTMNDLLGTGNCGIWVTNEIREALERVGLQLRKESISS